MLNVIAGIAAVARITTLITEDAISEPLRDALDERARRAKLYSFHERVAYMASCPSCTSVWAGMAVVGLSQFKAGRLVITALALSQLGLVARDAAKLLAEKEQDNA